MDAQHSEERESLTLNVELSLKSAVNDYIRIHIFTYWYELNALKSACGVSKRINLIESGLLLQH